MTQRQEIANCIFVEWARGIDPSPHARAALRERIAARWPQVDAWQPVLETFERCESDPGYATEFAECVASAESPYDALYAIAAIHDSGRRANTGELWELRRCLDAKLDSASTPTLATTRALIEVVMARFKYRSGQFAPAVRMLEEQLTALSESGDHGPIIDFVRTYAHYQLGYCYSVAGDFQAAEGEYRLGLETALPHAFFAATYCKAALAELRWASGQFEEALKMHSDASTRLAARTLGRFDFLVRSHLNAAKCAIDLGSSIRASEELESARQLLAAHAELPDTLRGHLATFDGELSLLERRTEEGIATLRDAVLQFEQLDPPCYHGALSAKTALCRVALAGDDVNTAIEILSRLIEEAEQQGCIDARSRLLMLESSLYVKEQAPLREAYQDLLTRVHLINNPTLLLHALGNLYLYAIDHLPRQDQELLLERMKRVRPYLAQSCFDSIYSEYVAQRYRGPLDQRLVGLIRDLERKP